MQVTYASYAYADRKCAIYLGILPVFSSASEVHPSHEAAENYTFVPKGDLLRVIAGIRQERRLGICLQLICIILCKFMIQTKNTCQGDQRS